MTKKDAVESIELMRGGEVVSTLTGAFGNTLKETRLTAMLGYLIAQQPQPFVELFRFKGAAQSVSLETRHENGRSDILIETNRGVGIVEAKIDATDPLEQSRRYSGKWTALLTQLVPTRQQVGRVRYVSWQELADCLNDVAASARPLMKALCRDFLRYLEVHHMIKSRNAVEVYAREINEPLSLELFLLGHVYVCLYKRGSRISEALYFAPHFGKRISEVSPGVGVGISYLSKIETVEQGASWQDFTNLMRAKRGAAWAKRHDELLREMRREWDWSSHYTFLLLGTPRLVFNPPVRKQNLQGGSGWLSKNFLSFDELFAARES
jgi:hypothetical protein